MVVDAEADERVQNGFHLLYVSSCNIVEFYYIIVRGQK